MTEPISEPPRSDGSMTTGEFRAAKDISASTAQFQAFAASQGATDGSARGHHTRLALLILAVVIVVAIIAILAVTVG